MFHGPYPLKRTKALPWTRCGAFSTTRRPPAFYNTRKLNLRSKTDISKTAWINAWTGYHVCSQNKREWSLKHNKHSKFNINELFLKTIKKTYLCKSCMMRYEITFKILRNYKILMKHAGNIWKFSVAYIKIFLQKRKLE